MMDKHSRITPTLLFILVNFIFGDFTSEIIVQSNGNFTLRPNVQGPLDEILWRWNGDKVVEFDQKEVVEFRQFKGRTILNLTTGALTLTRLTESDSGLYVCELLIKGLLEYRSQTVKVFDAVGKPAVTCQVKGTSVTLLCSGDNRTTTEYQWEGPAIEPQPGPQLEIEAAESSDSVYTCVLQNPVSQSRTDFPVKSCFPPPETSGIIPLVTVLPLLFIFIIVGLILFYCKKRYRKRQNGEDLEGQSEERRPLNENGVTGVNESLNEVEESEERVQTEGRNSPEHLSSGTVLSSVPVSPSATPPKTGSDDNNNNTPESSLSPPHPPESTPHSAQAPIQSQDQEEEPECCDENDVEKINKAEEDQLSHTTSISTDVPKTSPSPPRPGRASGQSEEQEEEIESSDETGANQRAGAQSQREERQGLDGGIDEGGALPSGAGGANLESNSTSQAQEEQEEERRGRRPPEKPPITPKPHIPPKPHVPPKPLSWTVPEHTAGRDSGETDTASHDQHRQPKHLKKTLVQD